MIKGRGGSEICGEVREGSCLKTSCNAEVDRGGWLTEEYP